MRSRRPTRWMTAARAIGSQLPSTVDTATSLAALPDREARDPILLLHGFASTTHVLGPLGRYLERTLGRQVVNIPHSPLRGDLRRSARRVAQVLESLARSRGFRHADVVGHSMGGLVGAYLLKKIDRGRRLRRVVTLGTPYHGAPLARIGTLLVGRFSLALRQMQPGSGFLCELRGLQVPHESELVSVAGGRDRIVPEDFARLLPHPRQRNVRIGAADHFQLLWVKPSRTAVRSALEKGAWAEAPRQVA